MKKKRLQYISLLLFLTYLLNLCVPCLPVQAEAISVPDLLTETDSSSGDFTEAEVTPASPEGSLVESVSFGDIAGHWAEKGIKAWTARQLAGGYPDGTFRPDSPITRAEFLTLVNRAFGYTVAGQATYRDVAETDWFAGEIAKAAAVGYLGGYPDGTVKPQNPITRQEAAALFAKILPPANLDKDKNEDKFTDQAQIPAWSQAAIAAAVSGGYMNGYPDGTFQPTRPITRAEAISVLDRAVGTLYNHAGTYGSSQGTTLLEGNVTINTTGVTLQNTTITGNLYLTEGIGEGDVILNNVMVQGTTKISGGGSNSIHLLNTTVGSVLVNVPNRHLVRLLAQGSTAVGTLEARTPARLEEMGLTGSGFTKVIINTRQAILSQGSTIQQSTGTQENNGTENNTPSQETEPAITVELLGQFSDVEIQSAAVQVNLQEGRIQNLTLASTAQAAQIQLAVWTNINTLTADTPATVQGQGTIETTQANVDGVIIEAPVKNVLLEEGVQAMVEGKTITASIINAEIKKKKSQDATLSNLTIDGTTVAGFTADTLSYDVVLPYGTTAGPTVAATAHYSKAKAEVTQATTLPGSATVLVIAENGSTQTYTVNFVKATVTDIKVKNAPAKITYLEGEALDLTSLVVTLIRTDKSTEDIVLADLAAKGITASPENGATLSPANIKVTLTHTASGMSVGQAITVTSTYTVTVAAVSGGTADVAVDKSKAKGGDTVTVSITNLESGKNFKAITVTSASGNVSTTKVTAGEEYTFTMPTEAVTVTVELEAITYMLTYTVEANGSISGVTPQTIDHGANGTAVEAVPATGYHFVNWSDELTENPRTDTNVMENISVTANFAINIYTVTFDKNGGETEADPKTKTVEHGGNVGTLPIAPTKTGYTFTGWNTQADGSGTAFTEVTPVTGDITVYAQWVINEYTVTFKDYDGTELKTETVTHGSAATAATEPTREGHDFTGWDKVFTNVTGDLTVTAQYKIKTYTLTYTAEANGSITGATSQTVNHGVNGTAVTAVPAEGYHFVKWSDDLTQNPRTDTNVTGNISVTANFAINIYTVTFDKNGGETEADPKTKTVEHGGNVGTLPIAPTKTGYTFTGWNTQADGSGTAFTEVTPVTGNIMVYAQWVLKVTGVTLNTSAITLAVSATETLEVTETLTAIVLPENASNKNVTWSSNNEAVATVAAGVVTAVSAGEATITVTTEDGDCTVTCIVTVQPVPIADFACTGNNGTDATFTWTAAVGATSIEIQQSTDEGKTWTTAYTAPIEATAASAKVVGLTAGAIYQFKLVVTGGNNAGDSNIVDVTTTSSATAVTYGASWTSGADTTMTRLGNAEGKIAGTEFNEFSPWSGMKLCNVADDGTISEDLLDRDGTNGQVMVKIPKFYYKHTYDGGTKQHQFWVADGPAAGYKLHPAFIRAGVEKDYILMGAYKAGEINDGGKIKLTSVSGALPAVGRTRATFRTQAQNRGANWCLVDALARNAVALLYLVEYADTHSQATIGQGITGLRYNKADTVTEASTEPGYTIIVSSATAGNFSIGQIIDVGTSLGGRQICRNRTIESICVNDENNKTIKVVEDGDPFTTKVGDIIYHVGQRTGGCDGLGNASGSADGLKGSTVSVNYRGLEDLWGNVWEFIDGINIKNTEKQPYIADDHSSFADNVFDGVFYTSSGVTLSSCNGYVSDFVCSVNADWLLMPGGDTIDNADKTTVGGGSTTYIPDYYYQSWAKSADKVARVGGYWNYGTNAGLFGWFVDSTSSDMHLTVGARVLLIP